MVNYLLLLLSQAMEGGRAQWGRHLGMDSSSQHLLHLFSKTEGSYLALCTGKVGLLNNCISVLVNKLSFVN